MAGPEWLHTAGADIHDWQGPPNYATDVLEPMHARLHGLRDGDAARARARRAHGRGANDKRHVLQVSESRNGRWARLNTFVAGSQTRRRAPPSGARRPRSAPSRPHTNKAAGLQVKRVPPQGLRPCHLEARGNVILREVPGAVNHAQSGGGDGPGVVAEVRALRPSGLREKLQTGSGRTLPDKHQE